MCNVAYDYCPFPSVESLYTCIIDKTVVGLKIISACSDCHTVVHVALLLASPSPCAKSLLMTIDKGYAYCSKERRKEGCGQMVIQNTSPL